MSHESIAGIAAQFLAAYQRRDVDGLRSLFVCDEDLVVLGSHRDLELFGWQEFEKSIERQFDSTVESEILVRKQATRLLAEGNAAVSYLDLEYRGTVSGHVLYRPHMRLTLAFELSESHWRITQLHWSTPEKGSVLGENSGTGPFETYQSLAQAVTSAINNGSFDFSALVEPRLHPNFTEVADGNCLDSVAVRAGLEELAAKVTAGCFNWQVQLESSSYLSDDSVLLLTTADVQGVTEENVRYRISNILRRDDNGAWVFIHQHRTQI
ncbi:nuclear transport factor 2 family protein [Streptomyces sp. NPDC087908]|uniref:nuclear transport factor 2 family protein n=1 Tax=Streptomyces sp. NPDC087908 TaxID=3365820 RepID=UPI0037F72025